MADPQRLLSPISDANELERELLGSLRHVEPPVGAQGEAWALLSTQIAAVGMLGATHAASGAAGGSAAAASATGSPLSLASLTAKLLGSKLVVGLALAGGALGASALWLQTRNGPVPRVANSAAESAAAPLLAPVPSPLEPVEPAPAPRLSASASERSSKPSVELNATDRLREESTLLMQARAQLRSGDAAAAQQTLTRLRANFSKGVLGQEREVLNIELLAARGDMAAARRRAKAFIAAYPKSPHSAQLNRFADAP